MINYSSNEGYDQDKDVEETGGRVGPAIANRIDEKRMIERLSKQDDCINLERIVRIALKDFPVCQDGESVLFDEISSRLQYMENAGYDISRSYKTMNKKEIGNYFKKIKKEIFQEANKIIPEVVEEVMEQNRQLEYDSNRHL